MSTAWIDIQNQLEKILPEGSFKVWIASLDGNVSWNEEESIFLLSLYAHNQYVQNWIIERHVPQIKSVAESMLGFPVKVIVDIAEKKENLNPVNPAQLATNLPTAPSLIASHGQFVFPDLLPPVKVSVGEKLVKTWKHSFETFIVGPCNQLAHAAAKNMIYQPHATEMLFLSSAPGLGKTHLTQALGKALFTNCKETNLNMAYLTAEEFTSQFIQASRFGDMNEFKTRFRSVDILLLEDIHFLRNKDKTQEELLAIIKNLQDKGCRVVFTSSFAPRELQGLDPQLTSRFCSGFVATLECPDSNMRKLILQHKAHMRNFAMPDTVAEIIADQLNGDIRLLESCLNNIILKSQHLNIPLTPELAYETIAMVAHKNPQLSLDHLLELVCSSYAVTQEQLTSKSRRQDLVVARNMAFYLIRKHFPLTLEDIGSKFNRKHSTVIKGITTVEHEIQKRTTIGTQLLHTINSIETRVF